MLHWNLFHLDSLVRYEDLRVSGFMSSRIEAHGRRFLKAIIPRILHTLLVVHPNGCRSFQLTTPSDNPRTTMHSAE